MNRREERLPGMLQPYRAGINASRFILVERSYASSLLTRLCPRRDSRAPKPWVCRVIFALRVAKSASLRVALAFAAHPFSLLKQDTRSSLSQNWASRIGVPPASVF